MVIPSSPSRSRGQWARDLRRYHRLIGLFFTPAILFFSVTGALQTLELHEDKHGPVPAWLANAATLHKHQRLWRPRPPAAVVAPTASTPTSSAPAPREHVALRLFVVLMAVALALSAISGCAIALHLRTTRRDSIVALVAGVIVPLILYAL